jgi:predicted ATP-dependent endonuclease of OLD family
MIREETVRVSARDLFHGLSSGHKIVLLTITRLVETVEERTLVLLDEPEAHLHPPLLAAFARALSDLLIDRNGVAIVATHSPVMLQEVPKSCAWKIRRSGAKVVAERPEIETFGENVGVLTREIFGLEVTHSGFHKLLQDNIDRDSPFEQVVSRFGGELGGEALAILRALIAVRDSQGSDDVES